MIKNGTVVSSTGADPAEVLIDGETIVAVLQPGSDLALSAENGADRVIDATGKLVVPGGVDVHTHMELPFGGTIASD
ncbi:MAG: amidohydrolase family protein, partial [bacterium]|nr:amidohydrolase family protein [bacterium]